MRLLEKELAFLLKWKTRHRHLLEQEKVRKEMRHLLKQEKKQALR